MNQFKGFYKIFYSFIVYASLIQISIKKICIKIHNLKSSL